MAASSFRRIVYPSSQLPAILPRIIRFNSLQSNALISRICGLRKCSNFKSKFDVTHEQKEPQMIGQNELGYVRRREVGEEFSDKELPPQARWRTTRQGLAKLYARQGKASGIDPSIMWPTQAELENIIKDEEEWCPSLQQMQSEIAEENRARELKRKKREELIAANMAKMPQMVAEYHKKRAEKRAVVQEQRAKRNRLLEEARDKLGYAIDPRSSRFQKMVEEIEKEERKKKKELKKKGIVV